MDDSHAPESELPQGTPRRRRRLLRWAGSLLVIWFLAAYLLLPWAWRLATRRHPALDQLPSITHTHDGIPGDPLNIALVGSKKDLTSAMLAAKWFPADPITLASSLRIGFECVIGHAYDTAPVSNLFLWDRKQDLAFEQPYGADPRRRHHVRFWQSEKLDDNGQPLWVGAATFDTKVGFSHTTGQITHHIDPDVDAERDKLLADLESVHRLLATYSIDAFQESLDGRNGGGDPYRTDGRLAVGVLTPSPEP